MLSYYPAEFVLPGHPDKLCDAIADRLVEEAARREKRALAGVEVAIHRSAVTVTGRIACNDVGSIDIPGIVTEVYHSAGYGYADGHPCPLACEGRLHSGDCTIHAWLPDLHRLTIWQDLCVGPLNEGEAEFRAVADDQSIVTGYAIDLPGTNYLPPEHWLASQLAHRLEALRTERPALLLGPDGKIIVVLETEDERLRLTSASTSLQQRVEGDPIALNRAFREILEAQLAEAAVSLPGLSLELPSEIHVNGAGNFAVGGPEGDNGLSGKKLVCDAYGPRAPIGGGALSGKDFYKADRAMAILARRLAKLVVMTGAARECTATLACFPGDTEARLIRLIDDTGRSLDPARWQRLLDLRLESVGDAWTDTIDLADTARHGHFTSATRPWEEMMVG